MIKIFLLSISITEFLCLDPEIKKSIREALSSCHKNSTPQGATTSYGVSTSPCVSTPLRVFKNPPTCSASSESTSCSSSPPSSASTSSFDSQVYYNFVENHSEKFLPDNFFYLCPLVRVQSVFLHYLHICSLDRKTC